MSDTTPPNKQSSDTQPGKQPDKQSEKDTKPMSIFAVLQSVLAAFFGVQKSSNRQRDFEQGNIGCFIITGVLLCVGMIVALIVFVNVLVANAASF